MLRGGFMCIFKKLAAAVLLTIVLTSTASAASTRVKKHEGRTPSHAELKEAERRLKELGFWTGPVDGVIDSTTQLALVTFQKGEGRRITGRLTRAEFNAIRNAASPQAKDPAYRHVEVDLDRQVLLL